MARRSVWSNPKVVKLAQNFVAAADEVDHLQRSRDPEGQIFNKVAERGHYAGRTYPTDTRQGTYAFAPSGEFLASINSNEPDEVADMLNRALRKWKTLSPGERLMREDPARLTAQIRRPESKYPANGLVLHVYSRDLPGAKRPNDWRGTAWNQDYAWFRSNEVRQFVPQVLKVGAQTQVPDAIARRLVAAHFIDNVRGQEPAFQPEEVQVAQITSRIVGKQGTSWLVRFDGKSAASASGKWATGGEGAVPASRQTRGVKTSITGIGTYDPAAGRFTQFEMAAVGTRWGATQYNHRGDELEPAPIGFYLELAGNQAAEQIPPANFWAYGW